jgi:hypothetical protein
MAHNFRAGVVTVRWSPTMVDVGRVSPHGCQLLVVDFPFVGCFLVDFLGVGLRSENWREVQ